MELRIGPFSMDAPDDYAPRMLVMTAPEAQKPKTGMMVTRQAQRFARNVTIGSEPVEAGTTSQSYADAQIGAMKAGMEGFQLVKRSSVSIGGAEHPLLEIHSGGPEGRLLQALVAYVVDGSVAYTLTASQLAGLPFNEVRAEYLAMFTSVKLG